MCVKMAIFACHLMQKYVKIYTLSMKNKLIMALMVLSGAFMASCSDDDGSIRFSSGDNSEVYTITCDKANAWQHFIVSSTEDWTVETSEPWIHLARTSYKATETVGMFKVSEFSGYNSRTGVIRIKAGEQVITITVIQMGSPNVAFASKSYQITNKNTSFLANISTNASLVTTIEYVERIDDEERLIASPDEEWLSCVLMEPMDAYPGNKKQLAVTAAANPRETPRYARIIVKDEKSEMADTLHLEQLEKDVFRVASDGSQTADSYVLSSYEQAVASFVIDKNLNYTEEISVDWIHKNSTKYSRETLSYTVDESSEYLTRTGTITLKAEGQEDIVLTVSQPGHPQFTFYVSTAKNEIFDVAGIDCDGNAKQKVKYWTNFADFKVMSNNEWLHIINDPDSPTDPIIDGKGYDGQTTAICFSIDQNKLDARSGSVTVVSTTNPELNKTLNVLQKEFTAKAAISSEARTMFLGYDDNWEPLYIIDDETAHPNFEYESIEWTSSDDEVATIDADGKIALLDTNKVDDQKKMIPVTLTATITLKPGYKVTTLEKTCKLTVAAVALVSKDNQEIKSYELDPNDEQLIDTMLTIRATNFDVQGATWSVKSIPDPKEPGKFVNIIKTNTVELDTKKRCIIEAVYGDGIETPLNPGGTTTASVEIQTGNDKLEKITLTTVATVVPQNPL